MSLFHAQRKIRVRGEIDLDRALTIRRVKRFDEEEKQYLERQHRRKVIADWKAAAKALKHDAGKDMLHRDARKIALTRIEDAARTERDFQQVIHIWDQVATIEQWRVSKQETQSMDKLLYYQLPNRSVVIPPPFQDIWWRQLLRGDFLDTLHDCPYQLEELTTSRPAYDFIRELSDDQREILFYWAIRQWSPQRIAKIRHQSDRNIRKVYDNMISDMQRKMYIRLWPKYSANLPLTRRQREFCERYWEQLNWLQKAKLTRTLKEDERRKRKEGKV